MTSKASSAHTPGPWDLRHDEFPEIGLGGWTVGVQGYGSIAGVDTEANARLIAAAPELLDALRLEHGIEDGVHHEPPCPVCDLDYRVLGES